LNGRWARPFADFVDAGPIDLAIAEIYVPVAAYLSSWFSLELDTELPSELFEDFARCNGSA
jgi:hypothetical protein